MFCAFSIYGLIVTLVTTNKLALIYKDRTKAENSTEEADRQIQRLRLRLKLRDRCISFLTFTVGGGVQTPVPRHSEFLVTKSLLVSHFSCPYSFSGLKLFREKISIQFALKGHKLTLVCALRCGLSLSSNLTGLSMAISLNFPTAFRYMIALCQPAWAQRAGSIY